MQTEERLNKAKKLAASLGVSLADLADVVSVLQEVREPTRSLTLDQFPSSDEVFQTLVATGKITQNELEQIDAEVDLQLQAFKILMASMQAQVSGYKSERNLSVRQLAEKFGMASRHVQKLLKGEGNPTLMTIAEIAAQSGKKVRLVFE